MSYIFPSDSISGFNESASSAEALKGAFFGIEYKVFMYRAKRDFINKKFGYGSAPSMASVAKTIPNIINAAPCVNEDFESSPVGAITGALAGWNISDGQNSTVNGSCTLVGCCPTFPSANSWIVATP
ncbi:MAG TPA: hypothetical protein VN026_11285, partial [Bacteroidia bacterium]|nr:hypothetical protein [Bacteroidia bacterium]